MAYNPQINGLQLDRFFISALKSDETLSEMIDGRLYGTAIPLPDEDVDNVPAPYVIVTFDGLTNEGLTKDDVYDGDTDRVTIGVEMTGRTLDELHALTETVRRVIRNYMVMEGDAAGIADCQFSAGRIEWDQLKPCYWQSFVYECSVFRIL